MNEKKTLVSHNQDSLLAFDSDATIVANLMASAQPDRRGIAVDPAQQAPANITSPDLQPVAEDNKLSRLNKLKIFIERRAWPWIVHCGKYLFSSKADFKTYEQASGIFTARDTNGASTNNVTIALTADWGTCTWESATVAEKMMSHDPQYTIHLGDTYYTGNQEEMNMNYNNDGAPWRKGPSGSFLLMGNHEMYSGGAAYFNTLQNFGAGSLKQEAAYFCLQTDYWLVVGIDTGYESVVRPFLKPQSDDKLKMDTALVKWLSETVNFKSPQNSKKGIIILSHHEYTSAYEHEYYQPAKQLAALVGDGREVIWLWGHEHLFAVYGKCTYQDGVMAYGRCIGHGGMPIDRDKIFELEKKPGFEKRAKDRNLVITDRRLNKIVDKLAVGFNGYAVLKLNNEQLTITYYSVENIENPVSVPLIEESWQVDTAGRLQGRGAQLLLADAVDFQPQRGKRIADMVGYFNLENIT